LIAAEISRRALGIVYRRDTGLGHHSRDQLYCFTVIVARIGGGDEVFNPAPGVLTNAAIETASGSVPVKTPAGRIGRCLGQTGHFQGQGIDICSMSSTMLDADGMAGRNGIKILTSEWASVTGLGVIVLES